MAMYPSGTSRTHTWSYTREIAIDYLLSQDVINPAHGSLLRVNFPSLYLVSLVPQSSKGATRYRDGKFTLRIRLSRDVAISEGSVRSSGLGIRVNNKDEGLLKTLYNT
jgi:hypothetical protein